MKWNGNGWNECNWRLILYNTLFWQRFYIRTITFFYPLIFIVSGQTKVVCGLHDVQPACTTPPNQCRMVKSYKLFARKNIKYLLPWNKLSISAKIWIDSFNNLQFSVHWGCKMTSFDKGDSFIKIISWFRKPKKTYFVSATNTSLTHVVVTSSFTTFRKPWCSISFLAWLPPSIPVLWFFFFRLGRSLSTVSTSWCVYFVPPKTATHPVDLLATASWLR